MPTFRIITHIHTKYSRDSLLPFFLLYQKCIKKGIDYIAITEHNNINGAVQFQKYCIARGNKLKVIVGEEVMTSEGEIIGLYLKHNIPPMQSPEATVAAIKKQNGIVYIPHPYDEKRWKTVLKEDAIKRLASDIDCTECHNGRNISVQYDKKQTYIANKYHLKKVIGSDAHTVFEVGNNYMETSVEPYTSKKFLICLNDFKFYPKKCLQYSHHLTKVVRGIKMLQRGDFFELCRIIFRKLK